ncbi:hypothetical protein Tsubulata_019411, partial [Turnera subulata]
LLTSKRTRQVVYTPCRSPPPPPSRPPSLPHRHPPPLPLSSSARIANLFTRFLCLSTYLTVGHLLGYRVLKFKKWSRWMSPVNPKRMLGFHKLIRETESAVSNQTHRLLPNRAVFCPSGGFVRHIE